MGRLNSGKQEIGRDGLLRFIDDLNANRARAGIPQRYTAVKVKGALTMRETQYAPPRPAKRAEKPQSIHAALPSAYAP